MDDFVDLHTLTTLAVYRDDDIEISDVEEPSCSNAETATNEIGSVLPTRLTYLEQIESCVKAQRVCTVEGPVGCGKTFLISHVAALHGRPGSPEFVKIHLGDQLDSKSLFGSYQCTEVPGEFVWRPSLLTKTLESGHWVLLEDVQSAPTDVLGALLPLVETRSVLIPGRGQLHAHKQFRLFATIQTSAGSKPSAEKAVCLNKFWLRVRLLQFTEQELVRIVSNSYPSLTEVSRRLVETFRAVIAAQSEFGLANSRKLGTRDLLKWCASLCVDGRLDDAVSAVEAAANSLCLFAPSRAARRHLIGVVAAKLSVNQQQVDYYCDTRKPQVQILPEILRIGCLELPRLTESDKNETTRRERLASVAHFTLTKSACRLLEAAASAVLRRHSLLLVGETGSGKTAAVQFLAAYSGRQLTVVNMSQQSESSDLLGGFKPVGMKQILRPLRDRYLELFKQTFPADKNQTFLKHIHTCFQQSRWQELIQLMSHTISKAVARKGCEFTTDWISLSERVRKMQRVLSSSPDALPFAYVEGALIRAAREGRWLLLDEINLAGADTLNCLFGLLDCIEQQRTVYYDPLDGSSIDVHDDFRLFACMNPATDVGKRDLASGLRNRFTEVFVDELEDDDDLLALTAGYLDHQSASPFVDAAVRLYQMLRRRAPTLSSDGFGHHPHYSLRTYCRALFYASRNAFGNQKRSLYEAFAMSFLTEVDDQSATVVHALIKECILGKNSETIKRILSTPVSQPPGRFVKVEGFWLECGDVEPVTDVRYVITATVRKNLESVARVLTARGYPVLLQGETSVGKTSVVEYLAKLTGNRCFRINNHEHTDLQEYIGAYTSDSQGRLTFVEGPLVQAMRNGYWVILDELNLAPPDVLEALNRVLDDNRELLITETQRVVSAHPRFALFATQNPPGVYGGRKRLSRAFRNRFVQLHFSELPAKELEQILHKRCDLPTSYAQRMVRVMTDLQIYRNSCGMFAGKESYMTLRDLFRWAERYRKTDKDLSHDWDQYLVDQGFLLLGGRCRRNEDAAVVSAALLKHFRRSVDTASLFAEESPYLTFFTDTCYSGFEHVVWTRNFLRMAVLAGQALRFDEPVLIVGETSGGKTSLCQLFAAAETKTLRSVGCHLMTEAMDFLGRLRPSADAQSGTLFEWRDGPLVEALREGAPMLIDEISLASDSVLERLNPVLEPNRLVVVTERIRNDGTAEVVEATAGFQLLATMNPGGDYGKKELSKALRNRFTEIWCDVDYSRKDMIAVVERSLNEELIPQGIAEKMLDFVEWFSNRFGDEIRWTLTLRDLLAWTRFVNVTCGASRRCSLSSAYEHGARLTLLDGLAATCRQSTAITSDRLKAIQTAATVFLTTQTAIDSIGTVQLTPPVEDRSDEWGIEPFFIHKGSLKKNKRRCSKYSWEAATCRENVWRLLRALSVDKPVLLEGPPGVGKSSLVVALASAAGRPLTRLNLSEQTDLSDLFGSDYPTDSADGKQTFAWSDGPLLSAMKDGHWILLDEMNLASQSVLEGLNACLDHRGEVFIPELGKTFHIQRTTDEMTSRFFACQNPHRQGGHRKGLPKSFLNRFSVVYVERLTADDEVAILETLYGHAIESGTLRKMVELNALVAKRVCTEQSFGYLGGPWEFNLRDLMRWADLLIELNFTDPGQVFDIVYTKRLRSHTDEIEMHRLFEEVFSRSSNNCAPRSFWLTKQVLTVGRVTLPRCPNQSLEKKVGTVFTVSSLPYLEALAMSVKMKWLTILVSDCSGAGKTKLVETLAAYCGHPLRRFQLTSDTDALELLGSYEQVAAACDSGGSRLKFEWVDSPLLTAFKDGSWLLVEDVNCCSPAVLDRLNAALEADGVLTLNECASVDGNIITVKAHPEFRLFFTVNGRHGNVSRAMRNRAMEISIKDSFFSSRDDSVAVLRSTCVLGKKLPISLATQLHSMFLAVLNEAATAEPYRLLESAFITQGLTDPTVEQLVSVVNQLYPYSLTPEQLEMLNIVPCLKRPSVEDLCANTKALAKFHTSAWKIVAEEIGPSISLMKFVLFATAIDDFKIRLKVLTKHLQMSDEVVQIMTKFVMNLTETSNDHAVPWDGRFWSHFSVAHSEMTKNLWTLNISFELLALELNNLPFAKRSTFAKAKKAIKKQLEKGTASETVLFASLYKFIDALLNIAFTLKSHALLSSDEKTAQILCGLFDVAVFVRVVKGDANGGDSRSPFVLLAWQCLYDRFLLLIFPHLTTKDETICDLSKILASAWNADAKAVARYKLLYNNLTSVRPFDTWSAVESAANFYRVARRLNVVQQRRGTAFSSEDGAAVLLARQSLKVGHWQSLSTTDQTALMDSLERIETAVANTNDIERSRFAIDVESVVVLADELGTSPASSSAVSNSCNINALLLVSRCCLNWDTSTSVCALQHRLFELLLLVADNDAVQIFGDSTMLPMKLRNVHLAVGLAPFTTVIAEAVFAIDEVSASISIGGLAEFRRQISALRSALWSCATPALVRIQDSLSVLNDHLSRLCLEMCRLFSGAEQPNQQLVQLLGDLRKELNIDAKRSGTYMKFGHLMMSLWSPPNGLIDPVMKEIVYKDLLTQKRVLINDQIRIVDRYFELTTGCGLGRTEEQCLKHPHPAVRALFHALSSTDAEIAQLEETKCRGIRNPDIYSFERFALELSGFAETTANCLLSVDIPVGADDGSLTMHLGRLQAWSNSADRFLHSLTDGAQYLQYAEVSWPYVNGLLLCIVGAALESAQLHSKLMKRSLTQRGVHCAKLEKSVCNALHYPENDWSAEWINFCLESDRLFTKRLQFQLVKRLFAGIKSEHRTIDATVLEWIWDLWSDIEHDSFADDKDYSYRRRRSSSRSDNGDDDAALMKKSFPDLSLTDDYDEEGIVAVEKRLNRNDLTALLRILARRTENPQVEQRTNVSQLGLHLFNEIKYATTLPDFDLKALGGHLIALDFLNKQCVERKLDGSVINVYTEGSLTEASEFASILMTLRETVIRLSTEFSEVAALKDILTAVDDALRSPCRTPIMRLAAISEKILAECAQWESVAHRGVSLESTGILASLRRLLVAWRRYEVQHWQQLLNEVDGDADAACLAASRPLIDQLRRLKQGETDGKSVLALCLKWLRSSTVGDFMARLLSVQLCWRWLEVCGGCDETGGSLLKALMSMRLFFVAYAPVVEQRKAALRSPIEKELKDCVKVSKFNDLNLWSVKLSVQKAHQQLFRIVKRYKEALTEPCQPLFDQLLGVDGLPPIPVWERNVKSAGLLSVTPAFSARYQRMGQLLSDSVQSLTDAFTRTSLEPLKDTVEDACVTLTAPVQYTGGREAMEKQYSRAMSTRHKLVSDVIRLFREIGFSHRKGAQMDDSAFSEQLMVGLDADTIFNSTRGLGADRETLLRALVKPHKQVSPQLASVLHGLTNVLPAIALRQAASVKQFRSYAEMVNRFGQAFSYRGTHPHSPFFNSNHQIASLIDEVHSCLLTTVGHLERTRAVWSCHPSTDEQSLSSEDESLHRRTERLLGESPFIVSGNDWQSELNRLDVVLQRTQTLVDGVAGCRRGGDTDNFWSLSDNQVERLTQAQESVAEIEKCVDHLLTVGALPQSSSSHSCCFDEALQMGKDCLVQCTDVLRTINGVLSQPVIIKASSSAEKEICADAVEPVLLTVQNVYKLSSSITTNSFVNFVDEMAAILSELSMNKLKEKLTYVWAVVPDHNSTASMHENFINCGASLLRLSTSIAEATDLFEKTHWNLIACSMSAFRLFLHLAKEGFVNGVPQTDADGADDGSTQPSSFQDLQQAGLGSGEGLNDVTDQIEETGQIEDLKGNEDPNQPPPAGGAPEVNKPIEADQDFDGELEDMQLDVDDSDSESEGAKEDEAPSVDNQMGDTVDEPDQEQLDPKLWDENEEEKEQASNQPEMSDDTKGADQLQDDLVAKDYANEQQSDKPKETDDVNEQEENVGDDNDAAVDGDKPEGDEEGDTGSEDGLENAMIDDAIDLDSDQSDRDEPSGEVDPLAVDDQQTLGEEEQDANQESAEDTIPKPEQRADTTTTSSSQTGAGDVERNAEACQTLADTSAPVEDTPQERERTEDKGDKDDEATTDDRASNLEENEKGRPKPMSSSDHRQKRETNGDREKQPRKRQRLQDENESRSLGDRSEQHQRTQMDDIDHSQIADQPDLDAPSDSDRWAHTSDARWRDQATDAATMEEARRQPAAADVILLSDDDEDDCQIVEDDTDVRTPSDGISDDDSARATATTVSVVEREEAEGIQIETDEPQSEESVVPRSADSTIHTVVDFYQQATRMYERVGAGERTLDWRQLSDSTDVGVVSEEQRKAWAAIRSRTDPLAAQLTENLRLILEPTHASKLQGDYRSGKRLNVRKLIGYVASNYRRNRIWLRRTAKQKRDYRVMIAVDDSQSMSDNNTRQMAYESLAMLETSLRLLEVGRLSVCKFGETPQLLYPLETNTDDSAVTGPSFLSRLRFDQGATDIAKLLEFTGAYFGSADDDDERKLLIIVSDGRGLFSKGIDKAKAAVRAALAKHIFIVFVCVDNPQQRDSIVDIQVPVFGEGSSSSVELRSYMDLFPFPFYVILRDTKALPAVVGDALTQWFQLITAD